LHFIAALDDVAVLDIVSRQADTHNCIRFFKFMNLESCLGSPKASPALSRLFRSSMWSAIASCSKVNAAEI
jgi:hypothetical protein